jgi:hypothetical protein
MGVSPKMLITTKKPSIVTEEETLENLQKEIHREMGKVGNENIMSAAQQELRSKDTDRSSIVKNLSLSLLDVDSPIKILDIFQRDYLNMTKDNIFVEELFMLLYFFKTQVREYQDDSARDLMKKDYRVQALIGMIMDRYTPNTDFAYQMSTI